MNHDTGNRIILWEAHRGGGGGIEMPESCLAGFEFGWLLGARPEADVNRTRDGVIVSVHDDTWGVRSSPSHCGNCLPDD